MAMSLLWTPTTPSCCSWKSFWDRLGGYCWVEAENRISAQERVTWVVVWPANERPFAKPGHLGQMATIGKGLSTTVTVLRTCITCCNSITCRRLLHRRKDLSRDSRQARLFPDSSIGRPEFKALVVCNKRRCHELSRSYG